jgi:predicted acylesterase/phospholipase RssA
MRTLVLGGGAAKGYAHIGVIQYLEEQTFKPDLIVGASMGALVGGFYAAGYTIQELTDLACSIDRKTKHSLFPPGLSLQGFIDGTDIVKFLYKRLGRKRIEHLPCKYASVATDLDQHIEVVIHKGDLVQAIRASISIPVVFIPYKYHGHTFIDGGFVSPVPITAALSLGATRIIAVNVLRRVNYITEAFEKKTRRHAMYSMKKVLFETADYATSRLIDFQEERIPKGFMMNIDTRGIHLSDFEKAKQAIDTGYKQAKKYRDRIAPFLET